MLHPVGAVVTRHDEAHRVAVEEGQVLAVHRIGDHHFAVARDVDVECLHEIRRLVDDRRVEPVECHLLGVLPHTREVEHRLQRGAAPARIAHGAVARLAAGHARVEEATTVARALVDRNDLDRGQPLDVGEAELQGLLDLALDLDGVGVGIDLGRDAGKMVTHEEGVVGCDDAVVEHRERRLELRRPAGQPDHRPLLRIGDQGALAVAEWHRHSLGQRAKRRERRGRAQRGKQSSSVDHF